MRAKVGDGIVVHGRNVGDPERQGEIVEVRGEDGAPPYLVRFPGGVERLLFPGSDCEVTQDASRNPG